MLAIATKPITKFTILPVNLLANRQVLECVVIKLNFNKNSGLPARLSFKAIVGFMLLVFVGQTALAGLQPGIAVSMESAQSEYRASDSLMLNIRYTNTTLSTIRFLMRDTALEGEINEDFLIVSFDGQRLPYTGRHVKRIAPTESEFVSIAPGQSVSGSVDVGFGYPVTEKGDFEITYNAVHHGESLQQHQQHKSTGAAVLKLIETRPIRVLRRTPNIDASCNATQRSQINQALGFAETIAIRARDALNAAPVQLRPTARRYTEWFGQYSPGRYATAQTAFNRIASALSNRVIGFDCTCDINNRENVFAFVFKNDPYNMNVCPVFFRVGPTGTDSRSGTIVHEISHFDVVISSDDFQSALNQSGSRQLANSNPSAAIRNANAFEYFAENTPFLAMPTIDDLPDPADLSVTNPSASDQNPTVEDIVAISATIANIGETLSPSTQLSVKLSTDAQISLNDPDIEQGSLPALQPGATFTFQSDVQIPDEAGQFWIGVCATPVADEPAITNNCSAAIPVLVDDNNIIIPPILFLLLGDEDD